MAEKVECLKVGNELYQIGDIVEIPIKECMGMVYYKGRISGFEKYGSKVPQDDYVNIDSSEKFKSKSYRICIDDIKTIRKI